MRNVLGLQQDRVQTSSRSNKELCCQKNKCSAFGSASHCSDLDPTVRRCIGSAGTARICWAPQWSILIISRMIMPHPQSTSAPQLHFLFLTWLQVNTQTHSFSPLASSESSCRLGDLDSRKVSCCWMSTDWKNKTCTVLFPRFFIAAPHIRRDVS